MRLQWVEGSGHETLVGGGSGLKTLVGGGSGHENVCTGIVRYH